MTEHATILQALATENGVGAEVRYRAGQVILHQGDLSDQVVMLRAGSVKVTLRNSTDEAGIVLALSSAPDVLGEQAALCGTPRTASVIALTGVTALTVAGADFRALVGEHPAAAAAVFGIIGRRLRESDQARLELATHTVAQRVAAQLVALAPQIGATDAETGAVRLPLTQQDLADWAGASREAIVRTLRLLRGQGVVTTERRQIVVQDLAALQEVSRGDARA
ncbi:Crp/Fnr family transcriptional regulator [Kitasatospora sp. NPDC048194]|uniref:Crp/Fnr family transcriptional regulator n=1 Tax=Kitasatospora sp. NPDC048194 TaxID=3364045 RepID=UPI00370FE20F